MIVKIKSDEFQLIEVGDRNIIVKGIGKLFYQEGLPLGMSAKLANEKGLEVSWLHVVDEFLKEGWSVKKIISKFKDELVDEGGNGIDMVEIDLFLNCSYENQREMIFQYLFGNKENAKRHLKELLS